MADENTRELSQPEWDYYRELHHVCLWQASALRHNIDPCEFQLPPDDEFKYELMPSDVKRTLSIIQNHAGKSLPLVGPIEKNEYDVVSEFSGVELKYFTLWAEGKDRSWKLPKEFPRFSAAELERLRGKLGLPAKKAAPSQPQASAPVERKPTSGITITLPHTTTPLDAVFKIMRDHWTKYDPKNPPKQTVVAQEIDKALGWNPQKDGRPSRNSDAIAAILRLDSLSDADKRGRRHRSGAK